VETRKRFKFLTNGFTLPALTIARIYKCRWQVELFTTVRLTTHGLLIGPSVAESCAGFCLAAI
jgi:IS4 transposase